ncbi:TauD/TfdA family dioxygenase [Nocardia sp. NPDC051463]|uniref:TauD/TfdA family dioxygenase n=1 Tax=Nocardia sp. NPDC051463 TaxID=3154845 RepID=UPI0034480A73
MTALDCPIQDIHFRMAMMNSLHMDDIALRAKCAAGQRNKIQEKLDDAGFVIVEAGDEGELVLDEIMSGLGEPVEYNYGTKLSIEPQEDSGNVQFSTRGMPLHTDAILNAGPPVKYIGMQCVTAPKVGGESLIASSAAFFEHAPGDLLDTMRTILIEYRSRVTDYYKDRPEETHPRVAPIRVDPETGQERLVIALPDLRDETRAYDAEVVGYGAEESAALLASIDTVLRLPRMLYAHQWQVGELMILDNRRVLHGRAPFPGQPRKLIRLSVA